MPRGAKRAAPARKSAVADDTTSKRGSKSLKRKTAISDEELSEGGRAEIVHEKSGGKWRAFAERAEEPESKDNDEPAAENGDAGAEKDEAEDEGDEEDDEDLDEDV